MKGSLKWCINQPAPTLALSDWWLSKAGQSGGWARLTSLRTKVMPITLPATPNESLFVSSVHMFQGQPVVVALNFLRSPCKQPASATVQLHSPRQEAAQQHHHGSAECHPFQVTVAPLLGPHVVALCIFYCNYNVTAKFIVRLQLRINQTSLKVSATERMNTQYHHRTSQIIFQTNSVHLIKSLFSCFTFHKYEPERPVSVPVHLLP